MNKILARTCTSLLLTGMLIGCETDGRITDFTPSALFLKHSETSAYPNINSVPEIPDPRLEKFSKADPKILVWQQELTEKQDALEQSQQPEQRTYNDPKWSLEE